MKKPLIAELNTIRRLGVEIECTIPIIGGGGQVEVQKRIAEILTANNLRAVSRGYSRSAIPANTDIVVEYDTSIDGSSTSKYRGIVWSKIECKTRILEGFNDYLEIVPKTLDIIRYAGAIVNHSCGLHIHLDLSKEIQENPRYPKSLLNLFYRYQDVIHGFLAPSRKGNRFSKHLPDLRDKWNRCKNMNDFSGYLSTFWSRYFFVNLTHLFNGSHRVEIRAHQGTLDHSKVTHWIIFLNRLLDHAALRNCQTTKEIAPNNRIALERLLTTCGFKKTTGIYSKVSPEIEKTRGYIISRWKSFNPDAEHALKPSRKEVV